MKKLLFLLMFLSKSIMCGEVAEIDINGIKLHLSVPVTEKELDLCKSDVSDFVERLENTDVVWLEEIASSHVRCAGQGVLGTKSKNDTAFWLVLRFIRASEALISFYEKTSDITKKEALTEKLREFKLFLIREPEVSCHYAPRIEEEAMYYIGSLEQAAIFDLRSKFDAVDFYKEYLETSSEEDSEECPEFYRERVAYWESTN